MPASYPASAKAFTTKADGPGNTILAAHINDLQNEVTAVETDLIAGLPVARGGTGGTTAPTAGGLVYGDGTAFVFTAAGVAGQIPISGGAAAPTWGPTPVAGAVMYGAAASHAYSAAGTAGQIVLSGGTGAPTFKSDPLLLLKANSGTSTNAAAENVDTFAVTGLTAKDTLLVTVTLEAVTQQVTTIQLYNATDSVAFSDLNAQSGLGALAAGQSLIAESTSRQSQGTATSIFNVVSGFKTSNSSVANGAAATFTTAWTGAWTLALRHGGVTAGGTFRWAWAVFVVKGQ